MTEKTSITRDEAVALVRQAAWGMRPANVWAEKAANEILDAIRWDQMQAVVEAAEALSVEAAVDDDMDDVPFYEAVGDVCTAVANLQRNKTEEGT